MGKLFYRWATPFTTGLFLVSLISGIALFFHWGSQYFHGMHEWLSMVLILPFLFHIWRNWRPLTTYFRHPAMYSALAVSLVASLAFAWPQLTGNLSGAGGPPPQRVMFQLIENGTLAQIAPLAGHTPQSLSAALEEKGIKVANADAKLTAIASENGKNSFDLVSVIGQVKK